MTCQSLCSIFSTLGRSSLIANSSASLATICWSSLKSSGVKTFSRLWSSSRKLPPVVFVLGATVVVAILTSLVDCKIVFTTETRRHGENL